MRYWILALAIFLSACSSRETLLRDLTERDANEIVAVLYTHQLQSQKEADAKGKIFSVSVNPGDMARAVAILQANGLPRENRPSLNEIFKPNGFAPSPFEERVRFTYGVSQELERTIAYMKGVLNVRVHIVIPEKGSRRETVGKPSASVFVNYDETVPFGIQVPNIRKLVAESVEGLDESRVEVVAVGVKVNANLVNGVPKTVIGNASLTPESLSVIAGLIGVIIVLISSIAYVGRDRLGVLYKKIKSHGKQD